MKLRYVCILAKNAQFAKECGIGKTQTVAIQGHLLPHYVLPTTEKYRDGKW